MPKDVEQPWFGHYHPTLAAGWMLQVTALWRTAGNDCWHYPTVLVIAVTDHNRLVASRMAMHQDLAVVGVPD